MATNKKVVAGVRAIVKTPKVPKYKEVTVKVRPGQEVIVRTSPRATEMSSSFFSKWAESCRRVTPEVWVLTKKHHPKCRRGIKCVCPDRSIKIADMHTMQLVNSIKWCIRMADRAMSSNLFTGFDLTRAQILAQVPQWNELLNEAEKRSLEIVGKDCYLDLGTGERTYAPWFRDARVAIGMRVLEGKNGKDILRS